MLALAVTEGPFSQCWALTILSCHKLHTFAEFLGKQALSAFLLIMVSGQLSDSTGGEGEGSYMLPAIISLAQLLPNLAVSYGGMRLRESGLNRQPESKKIWIVPSFFLSLANYGKESA